MDWNGIRDFLAVVEAGSLTAGAVRLGISQPTLSRRLQSLEEALGAKLLIRSPRHLEVTDAGKRIQKMAARMGDEANKIENIAMGLDKELEGSVRISATEILSINWLTPLLPEFHETHPGIAIELNIDNSVANLQKREADIALRLMRPDGQDVIASLLGEIGYCLYASRGYAEKFGSVHKLDDLKKHQGVSLIGQTSTSNWMRSLFSKNQIKFQMKTLAGVQRGVEAGLGIGPLLSYFGDKNTNLIRIGAVAPVYKEIWLCTLPEVHTNARIRAVHNFVKSKFMSEKQKFRGNTLRKT